MSVQPTLAELFRSAVRAIDDGDANRVEHLIATNPELLSARLEGDAPWLRAQIGDALDAFFRKPYLLWFVAEDPVRNGRLPTNIAQIASIIIGAAQREHVDRLQEQLDYALQLVSWSWIARDAGVQIELIDVLVDAGAALDNNPENALINSNFAAAEHLIARGAQLSLAAALCLEKDDEVDRLTATANQEQKRFSLVLAALKGKTAALRRMIAFGCDVNQPSQHLYPHGTPLHHAVCSGSLPAVRMLVDAGANLTARDTAWHGTPVGWADYYASEQSDAHRSQQYAEIAAYLRARSRESSATAHHRHTS